MVDTPLSHPPSIHPALGLVDLHLHSRHSDKPSSALHRWFDAAECHTSVEEAYRRAKARGMTLVTLTDHDTIDGALELVARHPADTFVSCEVTALFPEDACAVHVLVWGIDRTQFLEIDRVRKNLYALVEYLRREKIAHGLAHPLYPVGGRLGAAQLEKLLLLFDVFEGRNGSRSAASNEGFSEFTAHLDLARMQSLAERHRMPITDRDCWVKGLTGGSDDHAGARIGKTWTVFQGATPADLFGEIRAKRTGMDGQHGDLAAFAFGALQVAHGHASRGKGSYLESAIGQAAHYFFTNRRISWAGKFRIGKLRDRLNAKNHVVNQALVRLLDMLRRQHGQDVDEKAKAAFEPMAELADALLLRVFQALGPDLQKGNLQASLKHLGNLFPHLVLLAPFLASASHVHGSGRALLEAVRAATPGSRPRRVLWFTDTLEDLNGVSETLKKTAWMAHHEGRALQLVTCLDGRPHEGLPPNVLNLPYIKEFTLPYYEKLKLRVPSILKALQALEAQQPDLVLLSSPGPVGLLGILFARLMGIPAHGIYHTDFGFQLRQISGDHRLADLVDAGQRWFYGACEVVRVPSRAYRAILEAQGYDARKMRAFRRGLDTRLFAPAEGAREKIKLRWDLQGGTNLLYTGRVSLDKNMPFLAELFTRLSEERADLNLIVAGDGPYLGEMRTHFPSAARVRFTGRLAREELPLLYAGSDLLLFPSDTDTFGMTVFEAQSCGLPAVVSNLGGPQEVIDDGRTGAVARSLDLVDWAAKVNHFLDLKNANPSGWEALRAACRERMVAHNDFGKVLDELMGASGPDEGAAWLSEAVIRHGQA